jgi:hypothetical protein
MGAAPSRISYGLRREPRGGEYRTLVAALGWMATHALVVVRDETWLGAGGEKLVDDLAAAGATPERADRWPGTALVGANATVLRAALDARVRHLLTEAVEGLYDWQQPDRPEDLAFLRRDGTALLGSVAHEADAFLVLDDDELARLSLTLPWLPDVLVRDRRA